MQSGTLLIDRLAAPLDELDALRALARDTAAEPAGTLRVGASVAFGERWPVPRLAAFRARHPRIRVELLLDDAPVDLVAARIDVALRHAEEAAGPWVARRLFDVRYRVVAGPGYLARCDMPERPADIARHECIVFPYPGFRSRWRFREGRRDSIDVDVPGTLVISNALALRGAALAELGLALLADWLVDEDIAAGRLVDVFPAHEVTARDFDSVVRVLYPSRDHVPAKVRAFVDFVGASRSG